MARLAPLLTFCGAVLAGQAQAEICISQNARTQWGVPSNSCQVLDVVRKDLGAFPFPEVSADQEIGGDQEGTWLKYWIKIGPVDPSLATVAISRLSSIEGSMQEIVCRSRDLSQFVEFGGRVSFDFDLLTPPRSELALAERTDLTTFTVETCEAN
jgi:hypothetical protein